MTEKNLFLLDSYDYDLPENRIAQAPAMQRQDSRLLYLNKKTGQFYDYSFQDILQLMPDNALIIANNSKVIPARILGKRETGSQIELLFLEPAPLIDKKAQKENAICIAQTEVLLKGSKRVKEGETLLFPELTVTIVEKREFGKHLVTIKYTDSLIPLLKKYGSLPLPPYIKRENGIQENDITRYQTIYAKEDNIGSIAAPTAGLHFTKEIQEKLLAKGCQWHELTLHVGYGTFSPVRSEDIRQHDMHSEYVEITEQTAKAIIHAKKNNQPIIAIGTTSTRSLEGMVQTFAQKKAHGECLFYCNNDSDLLKDTILPEHGCFGYTNIFIYPGKEFHVINGLVTNFHLPKSSLIMLVSAFAGYENIMNAYQHAVKNEYRFFSYGDAMFIN